jgi:hypothetical protein
MGLLIPIHSRRKFTRAEAEELLPIVRRITERTAYAVKEMRDELKWVPKQEPLYERLTSRFDSAVKLWARRMSNLGCEPDGFWIVRFDAEGGSFLWRLGDDELTFLSSSRIYGPNMDIGDSRPSDSPPFGD